MKLVLLVSGGLGMTLLERLAGTHEIAAVFTDAGSEPIRAYCARAGLPLFVGNPRGGRATAFLTDLTCEVLLSVNYLYLIEEDLIGLPTKVAINVHGSLLPKYRGRTPHVWAIINGEREAGITAHQLTREMDAGGILAQRTVPIGPEMTGAELLAAYNTAYPVLIAELLERVQNDRVVVTPQDHSQATYFPKRTPADGGVDWNWSRQRLKDWVRAQAPPYPGAFCRAGAEKLQINKITFAATGFKYREPNGKVVAKVNGELAVKAPNGVVLLHLNDPAQAGPITVGTVLT